MNDPKTSSRMRAAAFGTGYQEVGPMPKPPSIPDEVMLWLCRLAPETRFMPEDPSAQIMYQAGRRSVVCEVLDAYKAQLRAEQRPMPPGYEFEIGSTEFVQQRTEALFAGMDPTTVGVLQ